MINYKLPNYKIGTTSSLPYGNNPSVNITYDISNILITGATGATGPQGDIGASLTHPDQNDPLSGLFDFVRETAVNIGTDYILAQLGFATLATMEGEILGLQVSVLAIEAELAFVQVRLAAIIIDVRTLKYSLIAEQSQIQQLLARVLSLEQANAVSTASNLDSIHLHNFNYI